MPSNRRLVAILFSDIAGYTAMMQRDEEDGLRKLRRYRQVLEERVRQYGGSVLKNYGDGSLCIFSSAIDAVKSALNIQQDLQQEPKVPLRIGIHVGDVVMEDGDIYGDGVNLAARIEALGAPGGVLFTERVIHDIRSHPEFQTVSLGKFALKNVTDPLEVFALANEGFPVPPPAQLPVYSVSHPSSSGSNGKKSVIGTWLGSGIKKVILIAPPVLFLVGFLTRHLWLEALTGGRQQIPEKSIAILPFEDLSPKGDQAHFSEGIAEEVLNALAGVSGLKVAGRNSSFSFKDKDTDVRRIGRILGVRTVLEGSVRREGERVRVMARLVNAEDGFNMWSQRYERGFQDIFAIQEEIAQAVAANLKLVFLGKEIRAGTTDPEAYENYLRGKHLLAQRVDQPREAVNFFRQAVERDPNFALAYAGLGDAYLWLGWGAYLPATEAFPRAREFAQKALAIDSSQAYPYVITASANLWYDWNWEAARQELEKATALNPSEGTAYLDLGWYYAFTGRFEEAISNLGKAIELDPLNLDYNIDLADIYRLARQFDKSREIGERLRTLYPNNSDTYWILGMAYYHLGHYRKAMDSFEETARLAEDQEWPVAHVAMALARMGKLQAAKNLLQQLERQPENLSTIPAEMALAYIALGDTTRALELLEQSYRVHSNWMAYLKYEPLWDPVRKEARFKAVLERMKFPEIGIGD